MGFSSSLAEFSQTLRALDAREHFGSRFNINLGHHLICVLLSALFSPFFDLRERRLPHQVFWIYIIVTSLFLEASNYGAAAPYEGLASSMVLSFIERLNFPLGDASSCLSKELFVHLVFAALTGAICVLSAQNRILIPIFITLLQRRNITNWARLKRAPTLEWAIRLLAKEWALPILLQLCNHIGPNKFGYRVLGLPQFMQSNRIICVDVGNHCLLLVWTFTDSCFGIAHFRQLGTNPGMLLPLGWRRQLHLMVFPIDLFFYNLNPWRWRLRSAFFSQVLTNTDVSIDCLFVELSQAEGTLYKIMIPHIRRNLCDRLLLLIMSICCVSGF